MKSKTAIGELIHFIENDMMQTVYTKQQILELLDFKLEAEKEKIINAHGSKLKTSRGASNYEYWYTGKDYYNDNFKNNIND